MIDHQARLRACRTCPEMRGPAIVGQPVLSPVMLVGQAPGEREGELGRPFAWTAGKTLFEWLQRIGLDEPAVRSRVYMAAVCRCFPGKRPRGGDRVPADSEVRACRAWLETELRLLRPRLLIPVGKLAISQFLEVRRLDQVVGRLVPVRVADRLLDLAPLPHPSGASTWHRTEPGRTLLRRALEAVAGHPAWRELCRDG